VASLFLEFYHKPTCGEVYNLGGGRQNSISILETVDMLKDMGFHLTYRIVEENRKGDHVCYITDSSKVRSHFPNWKLTYDLNRIFIEIVERNVRAVAV
jgi:CDP-paratose 2-epimerase